MLLIVCAEARSAGVLNLGIMAGAADDAGCVGYTAGIINSEMHSTGGSVTDLETTYAPVIYAGLTYVNESLMVKIGWEYATNVFYSGKGSVSGAADNSVEVDFSRYTFPVSAGIVLPLTDRDRLYFAGGVNFSYILMKVKQSNPASLVFSQYTEDSHTFSSYLSGIHIKLGGEASLGRSSSVVIEAARYFGNYKRVKSEDGLSETLIGINSFEIMAGINYSLDL